MKKIVLSIMLCIFLSSVCFAGTWQTLQGKWYYIEDSNTFAVNKWITDDTNKDGIKEYYYFDQNGQMLTNTITPDGYYVDVTGNWDQSKERQSSYINTTSHDISSSGGEKRELKNNISTKKNVDYVDTVKIGSKNWANAIKFSGDDSYVKANSGAYNRLSFEAGIKETNDNAEYLLTIYVNGEEAEVIDEFSSDGENVSVSIDENSEIMIVYTCTVENGTYLSANNRALYIRKAQFEKVKE